MAKRQREILEKAAYLKAKKNASQKAIASILGVSQTAVSRILKEAEDEHLFKVDIRINEALLPVGRQEEIESRLVPDDLQEVTRILLKENPALKKVRLINTGLESKEDEINPASLQSFSEAITDEIYAILVSSKLAAVAWGTTIASVVEQIEKRYRDTPVREEPIEFVPMMGEPLGVEDITGHSSSHLVRRLDNAINGGIKHSTSIAGVAAIVPANFVGKDMVTIKNFLRSSANYQKIFGEDEKKQDEDLGLLANRADCILTSTSRLNMPWGTDRDALFETAKLDRSKISRVSVGDLGGVLMKSERHASAEEDSIFEDFVSRWMGFRLSNLVQCAKRGAEENGPPGVVLVAIGPRKAPLIYRLVQDGLVNRLFIDQTIGMGLKAELKTQGRFAAN